MAEYVTKHDIVRAILSEEENLSNKFPLLAFDNEEQTTQCENCGSVDATAFRYNGAAAAGSDAVVFHWEPDLYRIIARGYCCYDCERHSIWFKYPVIEGSHRENNPERIDNVELGSEELVSRFEGAQSSLESTDDLESKYERYY